MTRCQRHLDRRRLGLAVTVVALLASAPAIAGAAVVEFPTGTTPQVLTAGPDGNVWVAESGPNKIARITPAGVVTEFPSGVSALSLLSDLVGIAAGPDGNLWFTENPTNEIGRITPTGTITEFPTGASGDHKPHGITAGPDGNLWFTETSANRIGKITPAGVVTEYPLGAGRNPFDITAGPDGNLWFTEHTGAGAVGRITTAGVVTEFPGTPAMTAGQPTGITAGPDGYLWFTENANPGAIGRISVTGALTEYTAGLTHDRGPLEIVAGNDGAMYFTENKAAVLGKVAGGVLTELSPGLSGAPYGIAVGGDGLIWFSEDGAATVGRLAGPGATTTAALVGGPTTATLAATVRPNGASTTYSFLWGTTTAYGATTSSTSAGSGTLPQAVTTPLPGLAPATTYHYRVVATNPAGTTYGSDLSFTTPAAPPAISATSANAVAESSATLSATVNSGGAATGYHFEIGPTTEYGARVPLADAVSGSDGADHLVVQTVSGLSPGTTYHFRAVATNSGGATLGADQTFTTPAAPPAISAATASAVAESSVTLSATVNSGGAPTGYHFEVGLSAGAGSSWPASDDVAGSDAADHQVAQVVTGLSAGTTYHYRLVAANSAGVTSGADQTFTTAAAILTPGALPVLTAGDALPPATRPVFGLSATVATVSGTVMVTLPGRSRPLPLKAASTIPVGTTIDATAGRMRLTNVRDRTGKLQTATFWAGSFVVRQGRTKSAPTVIALTPAACARGRRLASAAAKPRSKRSLWSSDSHGKFVTRGRSAVATVRGTLWLTQETCAGTLVKVTRGLVSVRDLVHHRTVLVRAGKSYLARLK